MKPDRIAAKAKLVESSPSDHNPATGYNATTGHSPATDPNPSSDDTHSSDEISFSNGIAESLVGTACDSKSSGDHHEKSSDSNSTCRAELTHFPNIDIEQSVRKESTTIFSSIARFLSRPLTRFAAIVILVLTCVFLIADRSNKEDNYRRLVDRAELDDLSENFPQAIESWKAAIVQATSLGDGNKTLADLYFRLAKNEATIGSQLDASRSIERSIALYETVPYTLPEQVRAKDQLLNTLPLVRQPELGSTGYETIFSAKLLDKAHTSLKKRDIESTIVNFRNYVSNSNDPFSGSQNESLAIWKELEASIPPHTKMAEKAIPLMLEVIYAEKFVPSPPYDRDSIELLKASYKEANSLLDQTIAKTGRDPKDYQTTKALGIQMMHSTEYKAAMVCFWRCLAIKNDPDVQKNIRACYSGLHPSSTIAAEERLSVLNDLHQLNAEAFGEESVHVTQTLIQSAETYWDIGDFERAEALLKKALERTLQKSATAKVVRRNMALSPWNNPELAYDEVFKFYALTGSSQKARALFLRADRDGSLDKALIMDLKEHYVKFCGKSNKMDNSVKGFVPESINGFRRF